MLSPFNQCLHIQNPYFPARSQHDNAIGGQLAELSAYGFPCKANGSINKGILSGAASILEIIKGLGFKNKKAAAFGSYGWSGESVAIITEELGKAGFDVVNSGIKALWNPDEDALQKCVEFGKDLGEKL